MCVCACDIAGGCMGTGADAPPPAPTRSFPVPRILTCSKNSLQMSSPHLMLNSTWRQGLHRSAVCSTSCSSTSVSLQLAKSGCSAWPWLNASNSLMCCVMSVARTAFTISRRACKEEQRLSACDTLGDRFGVHRSCKWRAEEGVLSDPSLWYAIGMFRVYSGLRQQIRKAEEDNPVCGLSFVHHLMVYFRLFKKLDVSLSVLCMVSLCFVPNSKCYACCCIS